MTVECWNDPEALAIGVYLDGSDAPDVGPDGRLLLDDDFLVLVNGWWEPLEFTIGDCRPGQAGAGSARRGRVRSRLPAPAALRGAGRRLCLRGRAAPGRAAGCLCAPM